MVYIRVDIIDDGLLRIVAQRDFDAIRVLVRTGLCRGAGAANATRRLLE